MRLADDDRGRVPFAVVAVLLLVGSATYAADLRTRDPGGAESDARRAIDRANAAARTALADAAAGAARRAARDPVVRPASTDYGAVLDDEEPFRDYLRVRIYRSARRALSRTEARVGGVRAGVSLPPVENASALAAAVERVGLRASNGTLRVGIRNVTLTARRGGRVVARERRNLSVAVRTPVLAVHDRVERYEERLNAGPTDGGGLGRRLTARLYALAWIRGYAYYGGAPLENVVSNRHVELLTNGAVLDTQRSVFGASDPAGRKAVRRATARIGLRDLIAPAFDASGLHRRRAKDWLLKVVLPKRSEPWTPAAAIPGVADGGRSPEDRMNVSVNETADAAFAALTDPGTADGNTTPIPTVSLWRILRDTYAAEARLVSAVRPVSQGAIPPPDPPGPGWTFDGEVRRNRSATVTGSVAVDPPAVEAGEHHRTFGRRVVRTTRVVRRWRRDNRTTTTTAERKDVYRVALSVVARHAPAAVADNPIAVLHEVGGPLGGKNLADVPATATRRLVDERGGADALARRAVLGESVETASRVRGERPDGLRRWVVRDLARLRERVHGMTAEVTRASPLVGESPPAALLDRIRGERNDLVDAPDTYRSVADKVRVAARAAYVRTVVTALEMRVDAVESMRSNTGGVLSEEGAGNLSTVAGTMAARLRADRSAGGIPDGRGGRFRLGVDGAPSYLTLATVTRDRVPAVPAGESYRPLVARNLNVFTYPYADVADTVVGALLGSKDRVSLRTAGMALRRANRSLMVLDNRTIERRRTRLLAAVARSVGRARNRTARAITSGVNVSPRVAGVAVDAALDRWSTTHGRALAVANGSAARAVTAEVTRRTDLPPHERIRLRYLVRATLRSSLSGEALRPPEAVVNRTATALGKAARRGIKEAVTIGMENATERLRDRWFGDGPSAVPAGLPVTPVPGSWYATSNLWHVQVRGEYARFTVRTRRGGPFSGVTGIQYARDGETVALDVDGDGEAERLGRASRVAFDVETTVAVVVPPGGRGVGDTDGNADERSKGWPDPGLVGEDDRPVLPNGSKPAPGSGRGAPNGSVRPGGSPRVGATPPDRPRSLRAAPVAGDDSHFIRAPLGSGMFHDERREVPETVGELRDEYAADLAAAVEAVGVDEATERTDLDRERVVAVADGDLPALSLAEAAALQALAEGTADPDTIVEMACDHLLLGMTTAVLDVDAVASNVDLDLTPKEVQQKLERRAPMSFEEYVALQHFIVGRQGEAF